MKSAELGKFPCHNTLLNAPWEFFGDKMSVTEKSFATLYRGSIIGGRTFRKLPYFVPSKPQIGSISAALSCLVYPPREEERGLLSRTAAGNRT